MNVVARQTFRALAAHGVPRLPAYEQALASACDEFPPPFGGPAYGDIYRKSAADPEWVAVSLTSNAKGEGDGARHLWDMAASTPDTDIASQIRQHAIDEARHARGYITLLELIFPGVVSEDLGKRLHALSPGYTTKTAVAPEVGSPYAYAATVDELIQMNVAEIRTRIYHLLQRPVLLAYCEPERRARVRHILDSLLVDETRHIAYTARLIERSAQESGIGQIMDLTRERVRDFNEYTQNAMVCRKLDAA